VRARCAITFFLFTIIFCFRSALLAAARRGEAFSLATGRPTAWERKKAETTWYEFACRYVDMKWKQASAKYRKDIARALTAAAPAMLGDGRGQPDDAMIRRALPRYAFNAKQRDEAPADVAEALAWVARNSAPVSTLAVAATARRVLVPTHPELTRLLREHLALFGTARDGLLFSGVRGGELPTITYRRAWINARQAALTATEQASPLARRPYDLRHACLSTWLNGGVYPTQVAEWTGHSVDVLLRIYAKCGD
jgi:integrase